MNFFKFLYYDSLLLFSVTMCFNLYVLINTSSGGGFAGYFLLVSIPLSIVLLIITLIYRKIKTLTFNESNNLIKIFLVISLPLLFCLSFYCLILAISMSGIGLLGL